MPVVANDTQLNGQNAHHADIDPAAWRNVHLRMEKPDGGELLVTLLRSEEWLKAQKAETGSTIRLTFVELGIDGPADVLAVEACPTIETGNGRVVTGTFRHSAANVIDLHVSSEDRPIGTTANHPFWSETRQEFVQAGSLIEGEKLRTASGKSSVVKKIALRIGSSRVHNLEVDTEHSYAVGSTGVFVHNSQSYGGAAATDASLGLSNRLNKFTKSLNGHAETFPFPNLGGTDVGDWNRIKNAMNNADLIHFNLDGMAASEFRAWLKDPVVGPPGTWSNAELFTILKDPQLLGKTIFYSGPNTILPTAPTNWFPH